MRRYVFILFIFSMSISANEIKPFSTDLCTGYKEGTNEQPDLWKDCCIEHDLYLWAGGTRKHRVRADKKLKTCVKEKGGKHHSFLMFLGVKLGSLSPFKLKGKQWGNAWGNKVRRKKLSSQEIELIEKSLNEDSKLERAEINKFVKDLKSLN